MASLDAEHAGEPFGRLILTDAGKKRREADDITAAIAGRKIRPPARSDADRERARMSIRSARVADYVFVTTSLAAR
jgi:hypothetical protein